MRTFAIIDSYDNADIKTNIIDHIVANQFTVNESRLVVFTNVDKTDDEEADLCRANNIAISYETFPSDCNTMAKRHNYIYQFFKNHNMLNFGFLHIIEGNTKIKKDLTMFLDDVENMMTIFNQSTWFNTVCDGMNYVYSKYNPRIDIVIDSPKYLPLGLQSIRFTSHANPQWICYNLDACNDQNAKFNEEFTIPMFTIIEFFARKRNMNKDNKTIDFMNMYPTVQTEQGAFTIDEKNVDNTKVDPAVMKVEDAKFKSMNIDFSPTNSIDLVLETMYNIMNTKIVM